METVMLSLCMIMPATLQMNNTQAKNVCKYEHIIVEEASKNNIEPELLAAVIYVESAFYPKVVSKANACGLTQVVPKWTGGPETKYKKYTCNQLKNPSTSIKVGAQVLSYAIRVYAKGVEDQGLCYYNAGSVCLKKKNLYKKLSYVKKVREIYDTITDGC